MLKYTLKGKRFKSEDKMTNLDEDNLAQNDSQSLYQLK